MGMCRTLGLAVGNAVRKSCILTRWERPVASTYKLNADGCSWGNPGSSGGGSLLRDHNGQTLWALADFYGETTNMVTEEKALMQGLQLCIETGFVCIDIEIDSLILVKIVNREVDVPWGIV